MFRKAINFLTKVFQSENQKETEFYKKMFVENSYWNSTEPNEEEKIRWKIIETFLKTMEFKKGFNNFSILDLGCGRGWLTNLLSDYGDVIGIEPVRPVVEYAKKIFPEIKFICGTSKDLLKNREIEKFDLIVTSEVIEHVPDNSKKQFIEDIFRLLNDNGHLIVTTPRKEAQKEWVKYSNPNQPIEDWILESELENLVTNNGFTKKMLDRFSISPDKGKPKIEIYQLWLFQKKTNE
ncbi:class I SAM-dependent methyltransferase [Flavobacterium muglaense]|uniref:Class I SAM-dependent methyltransferase n=1 Tax=Flavobacterium muglaense TaxID=2764716 RepID=A0A923MYQ1_9FLAO|nr:class I SAM-dependent methyltransferase [Flavobacterium muglaense]MBC5837056.1 class I SAM-dependent methyltransferase [Flavobacterium muglaense]MBC5843585.1 class I SAM-dependent methyltransferase [Flavobacterium muglaense]